MYKKIVAFLGSAFFFWGVWVVSIFQSMWLAITARYPMAFDEAYHYDVIRLHAKQWSPIFLEQPAGKAPYGALVRDPSYIYHYLMSLPYRLFSSLGLGEHMTIVSLRFISLTMFAYGLFLFRKLLQKTHASDAAINTAILFFIMIPTVPLLAGELNYDSLQFPLIAAAMLLTISFTESLKCKKFDTTRLALIIIIAIAGTLNKFTYLPVLLALALYIGFITAKFYVGNKKQTVRVVRKDWQGLSALRRRALSIGLAAAFGLFIWSYGVNIALYRNPVPPCHNVLGVERCNASSTWDRNYKSAAANKGVSPNPIPFVYNWLNGMHYRLFFTINGESGPGRYDNHTAPVITITAGVLAGFGALLLLWYGRRILHGDQAFVFMLFVALIYFATVMGRNYSDFLHLGQMLAINGRYLQPLLLPVILVLIASYQWAFAKMPAVKLGILAGSFLLFLSGGGITGFIHYSDTNWYFENQPFILQLNNFAKKLIAPFFLWRGGS